MTESELTCKELTELITDYLEERLQPTDRQRFEEHLSICSACVLYVDQIRQTVAALGKKKPLKIPSDIESDLLQTFRNWKGSRK